MDEPNAPQFPFGYGLSYTEFRYSAPELSTTKLSAKELATGLRSRPSDAKTVMTVSANVTNSGKVSAEEVVQAICRVARHERGRTDAGVEGV